jgi:hypothetical protein
MKHPNAAATGSTTLAAVVAVWLLGHFGITITAEGGAAIAGGASAVILYLGRHGVRGAWRAFLDGDKAKP